MTATRWRLAWGVDLGERAAAWEHDAARALDVAGVSGLRLSWCGDPPTRCVLLVADSVELLYVPGLAHVPVGAEGPYWARLLADAQAALGLPAVHGGWMVLGGCEII